MASFFVRNRVAIDLGMSSASLAYLQCAFTLSSAQYLKFLSLSALFPSTSSHPFKMTQPLPESFSPAPLLVSEGFYFNEQLWCEDLCAAAVRLSLTNLQSYPRQWKHDEC